MANATWNAVYTDTCNVLLENGGLTLRLLTVPQFLAYAGEVLVNLLSQTGMIKRIWVQQMLAGSAVYSESDQLTHLESVVANGLYLDRTSEFYLDNTDPGWGNLLDQPTTWNEDALPVQQVNLAPNPNYTGNQISIPSGQGGYGQIGSTANAVDFDITAAIQTPAGYGTIQFFDGAPFVEVIGPAFGVIAECTPSTGNIELFASALPSNILTLHLHNNVELVPDSFIPYLKYGILQKVFDADGELKDQEKAQYCAARYQEGVMLAQAILGGEIRDNG